MRFCRLNILGHKLGALARAQLGKQLLDKANMGLMTKQFARDKDRGGRGAGQQGGGMMGEGAGRAHTQPTQHPHPPTPAYAARALRA